MTFIKGYIPWNKGKSNIYSKEYLKKLSEAQIGKKLSQEHRRKLSIVHLGHEVSLKTREKISKAHKGKKASSESRKKMSISQTGKKASIETRRKLSESRKGDKGNNWKGGISSENHRIRISLDYRLWRTTIFERDKYTCLWCGIKGSETGGKLNADHIKRLADYPELRFDLSNGRTLCVSCHKKTDTFGNKKQKYETITNN